jgi:hypothetical protein
MPNISSAKVPSTNDNYIGVEIEFYAPTTSTSQLGFDNHVLADKIQIGGDGSIHPEAGHHAYELKLLTTEQTFSADIKTVCDLLLEKKAKVNDSCGLHIHFDMRNRNVRKSYYNLIDANDFVIKTVPYNRQNNTYCKSTMKESFYDQKGIGHYGGVNASAYDKYKTIEIRFHEATLDSEEIDNYAHFMLKIINSDIYQMTNKFTLNDIDRFTSSIDLSAKLTRWLHSRISIAACAKKDIDARIRDDEADIQRELEVA